MRKMKQAGKDGQTIEVIEIIILKNFWEIYVIEIDGYQIFGLTLGQADELGYSSYEELKPYIACRESDLSSLMAAPNWSWVDECLSCQGTGENIKAHNSNPANQKGLCKECKGKGEV